MSQIDKYHARQEQQARRKQEKQSTEGFGKRTFRHPDKMTRFTWWVSIFTGCLFATALIQAWAFVQSERAYLTFTNFNFIGGLTANQPLALLFNAKNSGKSAAEIRNISVTTVATPTSLTYPLKYDKLLEIATNPIEAGATSSSVYVGKNIDGSPFVMHPITVADIAAGRAKLFVYGFADYEDDFSIIGSRRSHFCYLYLPERSTPGNAAFGGCPITQQH